MNSENYVVPEYGGNGFTCPNCQAYSHQDWNEVLKSGKKHVGHGLFLGLRRPEKVMSVFDKSSTYSENDEAVEEYLTDNAIAISTCFKCFKEAFWIEGKLIYPHFSDAPPAHIDMPEEVKEVYNEAKGILDLSPRASAALLRLALEKLLPLVGAEGKNINSMIGDLVSKGLSEDVQNALDGLRVIGNEAVHPGTINIQDNKDVSKALFEILNFIVYRLVTEKKRIKKIYGLIPDQKIEGIDKRDFKNNKK